MKIHLSPPLIVLMTDFGTSDPYVGIMKGVIETMAPQSRIIDLTHAIEPQNILQASFLLSACFRDFPEGTIFVCVVDPGVGTARLPVLAHAFHAFFIGPDNGLFGFLNEDPDRNILHLTQKRFFRPSISPTFHGRDIFAPVKSMAEALGQAATQAPQPIQAAASMASSVSSADTGMELASGA